MRLSSGWIVGFSIPIILGSVMYIAVVGAGLSLLDAGLLGISTVLALIVLHNDQALRGHNRSLRLDLDDLEARLAALSRGQVELETKTATLDQRFERQAVMPRPASAGDVEMLGSIIRELAEAVSAHDKAIAGFGEAMAKAAAPALKAEPARVEPPRSENQRGEAAKSEPGQVPMTTQVAQRLAQTPGQRAALLAAQSAARMAGQQGAVTKPAPRLSDPAPPVTPTARLLREAIVQETLELYLQPIVGLPQRKTQAYEATLRPLVSGGGAPLSALEVRSAAATADLSAKLDLLSLTRAARLIEVLSERGRDTTVLCPLSAAGLADAEVVSLLRRFVGTGGIVAKGLIPAISQSSLRSLGLIENETLEGLVRGGLRFAMIDTRDLKLDAHQLVNRGIRYVRVPAGRLLEAVQDEAPNLEIHVADLAGLLARHGIQMIADGISSEQFVLDMLDFGVPLAQGDLFSPPRQVRPEILEGSAGAAPAPAAPPSQAAEAEEKPARVPFRSLLRRASV